MRTKNDYQIIDPVTWKREPHFKVFSKSGYPHVGLTTEMEVTELLYFCRQQKIKFFASFLYVTMKALNSIENFRYRLQADQVILCQSADPSFTVFDPETELLYFATADYLENGPGFLREVGRVSEEALRTKHLELQNRLDVVYATCLPWCGFSQLIQPVRLDVGDSIPRIAWGRLQEQGPVAKTPFSILAHHGLVDGFHIGRLLAVMGDLLAAPRDLFR